MSVDFLKAQDVRLIGDYNSEIDTIQRVIAIAGERVHSEGDISHLNLSTSLGVMHKAIENLTQIKDDIDKILKGIEGKWLYKYRDRISLAIFGYGSIASAGAIGGIVSVIAEEHPHLAVQITFYVITFLAACCGAMMQIIEKKIGEMKARSVRLKDVSVDIGDELGRIQGSIWIFEALQQEANHERGHRDEELVEQGRSLEAHQHLERMQRRHNVQRRWQEAAGQVQRMRRINLGAGVQKTPALPQAAQQGARAEPAPQEEGLILPSSIPNLVPVQGSLAQAHMPSPPVGVSPPPTAGVTSVSSRDDEREQLMQPGSSSFARGGKSRLFSPPPKLVLTERPRSSPALSVQQQAGNPTTSSGRMFGQYIPAPSFSNPDDERP